MNLLACVLLLAILVAAIASGLGLRYLDPDKRVQAARTIETRILFVGVIAALLLVLQTWGY